MPFMKPYMVKLLREQFPPGTRIRLGSMSDPYAPVPYAFGMRKVTGIMLCKELCEVIIVTTHK